MPNPKKIKCTVSSVTAHDGSTFTVTMTPAKRLPRFKPGQFLHLALDSFDPTGGYWPESRVFSIASAPFDTEITIAYAVKGAFTQRMKGELEIGRDVWVKLPYGHFSVESRQDEEVVLVAGGTGVTPFVPFLLGEMQVSSKRKISLVYGVRGADLFLFIDVLSRATAQIEGFTLDAFSEEGSEAFSAFPTLKGKLTVDRVMAPASDPENALFYLSGPIEMIRSFRDGLNGRGVRMERVFVDEWE